jgi:membrane-associated phospholipid phosphatase
MLTRLRSPQAALVGALLCALATAFLVILVYAVPGAQRLDATALHGFNSLEGGLERPAWTIAFMSAPLAFVPGLPLLVWAGRRWGRGREALVGVAVMLASAATAEAMKFLITTERFQPVLGIHQVKAGSFPSGTVAIVMGFVVAALIVVPDRLRARTAIIGGTAVAAVAISVMVDLWHFPSDVLGGILVPIGYGFLGIAALRFMRREPKGRKAIAEVRRPAHRISRKSLEVAAATVGLLAAVALLVAGERIAHYADQYTTTVIVAMAILAAATALLAVFGLAAADES